MSPADLAHYRDLCAMREQMIGWLYDRIEKAEEHLPSGWEWCEHCDDYTATDYHTTIERGAYQAEEGVSICGRCKQAKENQ